PRADRDRHHLLRGLQDQLNVRLRELANREDVLPWKSDIRPHIRRFNLKNARPDGGARIAPRRRSRPPHGFESFRPNWVTFEGRITIPPSASMYRFQSVVFFCACFARSTAIVATTFFTTSSTSTPRISRNRYFMRSRS